MWRHLQQRLSFYSCTLVCNECSQISVLLKSLKNGCILPEVGKLAVNIHNRISSSKIGLLILIVSILYKYTQIYTYLSRKVSIKNKE